MNAIAPRDPAALPPEGAMRPLATLLGTRTGAAGALPLPVAHALSVEHVRAFTAVADRLPDTPLVAAWALLLARWSGQSTAAWAELSGTPVEQVRAAFHYVRQDRTVAPVDLLDAAGLHALVASIPTAAV